MKVKEQEKTEADIEKKTEEKPKKETKEKVQNKSEKETKEKVQDESEKETKEKVQEKSQKEAKEKAGDESQKEAKKKAKDKSRKDAGGDALDKSQNLAKEKKDEKTQKEAGGLTAETREVKADDIAESGTANAQKGGKAKGFIITFAVVLVLFGIFAAAYIGVAKSYSARFLPASQINGMDCGDMDAAEASARLTPSVDDYVLEVKGRDLSTGQSGALLGSITAADVEMRYEGILDSVTDVLARQNEYRWIFARFADDPLSYSVAVTMTYDEEKAKGFVQTWDAFRAENMRESQEAFISECSENTDEYQVIPRTVSTVIDAEKAQKCIIEALHNYETELDLEALGCYEEPVGQDVQKLYDAVDTANKWLNASVTYDWNGTEVVLDKQQLRKWISIVDDEPVLDTEQVKGFVKKQASANDTYGKTGSFTTVHGVKLKLHRASYGWKTDVNTETEELIKLIQEGVTVNRKPVYSMEARKQGESDIGDSYVEVDLTHQHLYLHHEGKIILETDFVSGSMNAGNATPQGIFGITYKKTDAVLRGADYETPVKYWMPFYGNYGMHDATWRRVFGGDIYINGGSHGCINLPLEKAAEIFLYMSKGFPVICYYYEVDPLVGQEVSSTTPNPGEGQGNTEDRNPSPSGTEGQSPSQGSTEVQPSSPGQGSTDVQPSSPGQGGTEAQNPSPSGTEGQLPSPGQDGTEIQIPSPDQNNAESQDTDEGEDITGAQEPGEALEDE